MKVMNPGNIDAQPTASVGHHAWEVYVRAKLPIVDLDGGDAGGDTEVSIAHDGNELWDQVGSIPRFPSKNTEAVNLTEATWSVEGAGRPITAAKAAVEDSAAKRMPLQRRWMIPPYLYDR